MKKATVSFVCVLFVSVVAMLAWAEGEKKEGDAPKKDAGATTIKGEVLDMSCFMAGGAKGEGHAACATKCLKGGSPMGIMVSDDKVYLVVNHGDDKVVEQLKGMAAKQVTVTGKISNRGGINGINVQTVEGAKGGDSKSGESNSQG